MRNSNRRIIPDMKIVAGIVILSFLVLVQTARGDDPHEINRAKCRDEVGLTEDVVKAGATDLQPNLGCYIKCLMQDTDVMSPEGVMIPEMLLKEIGKDIQDEAEPTIFSCAEETKDIAEACEAGFKYFDCFRMKNPTTFAKLGVFGKPENRNY